MTNKTSLAEAEKRCLTWGVATLDENLLVRPGDLVVVGGRTLSGKTRLATQLAVNLAKNYRVGYFSLESNVTTLMNGIVATQAKVPLQKICRRNLSVTEKESVRNAVRSIKQLDLTLIQAEGARIQDIRSDILNHEFQVVFLDSFPIHVTPTELRRIARSLGVTVVALVNTSRSLAFAAEYFSVEQFADVAAHLYNAHPDSDSGRRVLRVLKGRADCPVDLPVDLDGLLG